MVLPSIYCRMPIPPLLLLKKTTTIYNKIMVVKLKY
jgi:hypothetical protein